MTATGRAVLVASGIFYLVGVINDNDGAYVICWTGLSLLISCFLLSRVSLSGIHAECSFPQPRLYEGQQAYLSVVLHNAGSLNKTGIVLETSFQNETQNIEFRRAYAVEFIGGGERLSLRLPLPLLLRGRHRHTRTLLIGSDPLGLFRLSRPILSAATLLVYPRVEVVQSQVFEATNDTEPQHNRMMMLQSETGTEFYGIREYYPGDDLRRVHWMSTARHAGLVIREFEATTAESTQYWIDLGAHQTYGHGADSSLEWALRIAASMIHHQLLALVDRGTVSLWLTGRSLLHIPAGRGMGHFNRIMDVLATVRADGANPLHQVMTASPYPRAANAVVVITADIASAERIAQVMTGKGAKGKAILLDPSSFTDEEDASPALPFFEEVVSRLQRGGWQVAPFRRGDSIRELFWRLQQRQVIGAITGGNARLPQAAGTAKRR